MEVLEVYYLEVGGLHVVAGVQFTVRRWVLTWATGDEGSGVPIIPWHSGHALYLWLWGAYPVCGVGRHDRI